MKSVNIHEAKTHLSRLVEAAARGESFIIAKAGKPMVKVVPVEGATKVDVSQRIGFLADTNLGAWWNELDHAALDREIETLFEDGPLFPETTAEEEEERAAGR
jgi:prevent-host-death family protein